MTDTHETHNPQRCIAALTVVTPWSKAGRTAVSNAIACINHMQNVLQRQRKQLDAMQKKADP